MRLLIKERVFSFGDTYDIYDEYQNVKYCVKEELLSFGHQLRVYDAGGNEIGQIKQKLLSFLPQFEIEVDGRNCGTISKQFALFHPKYEIDVNGWRVEGDFLGWNYDVYEGCSSIIHINKEPFNWGDTYVIDFMNPTDELMGLMLVIAIDAANRSDD